MTQPPDRFDHPWERRLHDELRRLPDLEAPSSLVPDVMAAIRARQHAAALAWYRRPATTWHPALRVALGVVSLAVFALVAVGLHAIWPAVVASAQSGNLAALGSKIGGLASIVRPLFNAFALVMREALSSPWLLGAIAAAACSYLALFSAGSAFWRHVLQPRHE